MLTNKVFLTQTDTTIGFVSQNAEKLTRIKQRPPYKHYIKALNSLNTLKVLPVFRHGTKIGSGVLKKQHLSCLTDILIVLFAIDIISCF